MSDVVDGSLAPQAANAAVNAGGKLLKVVEMQNKYGVCVDGSAAKKLDLLPNEDGQP